LEENDAERVGADLPSFRSSEKLQPDIVLSNSFVMRKEAQNNTVHSDFLERERGVSEKTLRQRTDLRGRGKLGGKGVRR